MLTAQSLSGLSLTEMEQEAQTFLSNARNRTLAVDTETNGEDVRDGRGYAIGVSVAYRDSSGVVGHYFPFRHAGSGNYSNGTLRLLKDIIESAPTLVFHNAKFDLVSLRTLGINCFGSTWYDTMIIAHLLNENWPKSKSLNECAKFYLGPDKVKVDDPAMRAIWAAAGPQYTPVEMMRPYATQDAVLTYILATALFDKLMIEGLQDYWPHKRALVETVSTMEQKGVLIDQKLCERMIDESEWQLDELRYHLDGLNPRSPKDMRELFINRLGLPPVYHPKTGRITFDKTAMALYEQILERQGSDLGSYVLAYRGWGHAASLFYRPYLELLSPDGRLRPSYRHHKDSEEGGTLTGRLSCADPNLQQIPRVSNKPWNDALKRAFLPTPGTTLWEADYSQLELRLGTAYAHETSLKRVFEEDRDVFSEMAAAFGLSRQDTKTLVYSMQYGAGINRLMNVFSISETEAAELKDTYFSTYPGFKRIADAAQNKARSEGRVRLWSGRYRHFSNRKEEAHKALNSIIQGGAADVVERRMNELRSVLAGPDFSLLLQVHDSVVFEIAEGKEDVYLPEVKRIMEDVQPNFGVKFAVDVHKFGGN